MKALTPVLAAAVMSLSVFSSAHGGAVLVESTFDTDAEGWRTFTTASGFPLSNITFVAGSGNPGGAVRHDAPSDGQTSFFLAPSTFPTALHSAIGGSVDWDLATISHPDDVFFTSVDIQIRGSGENRLRLEVTPPAPPAHPEFKHYHAAFSTGAGWDFFDGTTTTPATQAEIDAVLAAAVNLIIRAEYFSGSLPDSTFLDNVTLRGAAAVPEPATLGLVLIGIALFGAVGRHRRHGPR